ncbi:MAG: hypothetical protein ACFCD0_06630 [Gemmataceae bacterium]
MEYEPLSSSTQIGLAVFYLFCVTLNVGFAAYCFTKRKDSLQTGIWSLVAFVFFIHAAAYSAQAGWRLDSSIKMLIDYLMGPVTYFFLACVAFTVMIIYRKFFTDPIVAWTMLNLSLLLFGWAMTDNNFKSIIAKPDNVPITILIYSVGFTTWLAMRRAVINDERLANGDVPLEKDEEEKVLTWPDLVYTELIAMVICTFLLIIWAVFLPAPLEQPASSSRIPNPSKAPWYFLGLQELLVYYDPWMAGVVLPSLIIVGLIALPYIDYNQKGNGYYTFNQRPFAVVTFLFGFVVLWVILIILGTVLRGPNWNFYGPFEYWDPHKTVPLNNINLSEIFWLNWFGVSTSSLPWYIREAPGAILVLGYLALLPPLLAKTILKPMFVKMGFVRFIILVTLIQFMAAVPIKMVLRWTLNLKYIVAITEYFFNI